jgi:hypothetical protein
MSSIINPVEVFDASRDHAPDTSAATRDPIARAASSGGFGPTVLSAADFKAFERQIESDMPNPAAEAAIARGMAMMAEFNETGSVKITTRIAQETDAALLIGRSLECADIASSGDKIGPMVGGYIAICLRALCAQMATLRAATARLPDSPSVSQDDQIPLNNQPYPNTKEGKT